MITLRDLAPGAVLLRILAVVPTVGVAASLTGGAAWAQVPDPYIPSASDFGGVGLLQTRTARFGPDGQLDVGYSSVEPYQRYLLTVQAFPWLEGTFRYTSVDNRDFTGNNTLTTPVTFKDRGADLKFKVLSEGRYVPQIAVGFQDGLGTGIFGGEYVVLSKRFYDLDFSLGMGWGYNGQRGGIRNPLTSLSDRFRVRDKSFGQGGTFAADQWFTGEEVSLFGGIEYATPIRGVSLKLEYDGNDYRNEPLLNSFEQTSPINFGVHYRPFEWIDLSAAWERGNLMMFRVSLRANMNALGVPKFDPPPATLGPRPPPTTQSVASAAPVLLSAQARVDDGTDGLMNAATSRGYNLVDLEMTGVEARVTIDRPLRLEDEAQLPQALLAAMPPDITIVRVHDANGRQSVAGRMAGLPESGGALQGLSRLGISVERIAPEDGSLVVELAREPSAGALEQGETVVAQAYGVDPSEIVWRVGGPSASTRLPSDGFTLATLRTPQQEANIEAASRAIIGALEGEKVVTEAVLIEPPLVTVYFTPTQFRATSRNLGRVARVVANAAPADVEEIALVVVGQGMEISRTSVFRKDLERAVAANGSPEEIFQRATVTEAPPGIPRNAVRADNYPAFSWSASPQLRQNIGGGDTFYAYQIWLALGGQVRLAKGLNVAGTIGLDAYNTFDDLKVESPSTLPKVRSDIKNYLQQGENNIVRLQANQLMKLAPAVYGRVSAGLFEEMYGGFGGEILFRPIESRFAIGIDLNWVKQRDFDQRFTFRDYSVTTGHLNLYYELPYYNLLAQAHIGQYLAKDKGVTFQLSREFESGMRAGVFATLTDVPFDVFGEGSFDKGFFVAIPLDLLQLTSSRRQGVFAFRPLTKDGGQRLGIGPRLYDITDEGSVDSIGDSWDTFLN